MNTSHQLPILGTGQADFKVVVDLGESLGQFYHDLGDPAFASVQSSFATSAAYIARGIIHNILNLPGALTVPDTVRFFPMALQPRARLVVEALWSALATEVARMERLVEANNPGRRFVISSPPPLVGGFSTLTIWYRWLTEAEIAYERNEALVERANAILDERSHVPNGLLGY